MSKFLFVLAVAVLCLILTAGAFQIENIVHGESPQPAVPTTPPSSVSFDSIKTNLRDYIWPTDAGNKITSTFAEYRSTHFHGGIDISTNGTTGYHVFAVREGYVFRIKILPDGYGKMLFLKHPDGYVSTYAHLKGFSSTIEATVRKEQYKRSSFAVDFTLGPTDIPVHKGEVVAYTGDSGFGPPHLHFELRDENMNPINPLLVKSYHMEDDIPPSIRRLMISPLAFNSSVENSASPKFYSRFGGRNNVFHNPQRVRIEGEIGFGVDASDRANNTYTHCGIHRMEFFFDDSLVYVMQLDRVPDDDTKEIDLHYDLPSLTAGTGRFQKLYIDIGNTLPFYEHRPAGSGIINTNRLTTGVHHYRIVCIDFPGNRSELDGEVVVANKPIITVTSVDQSNVHVEGPKLASIDRYVIQGKRIGASRWNVHTLSGDRFERAGDAATLPVNSSQYDVLKVTGETSSGVESSPAFFFLHKQVGGKAGAILDVDPLRNFTRVTLTTKGMFTSPPSVLVKEGPSVRSVPLEAIDVNKYTGAFDPSDNAEGAREIDATVEVNGVREQLTKTIELFVIPPDRAGTFSYEYGSMLISYDTGAVYQPLYMKLSRDYYNGTPAYSLDPGDVLLRGGIVVSLPKPANSRSQHLGLYYRYNGGWKFQTGKVDADRAYFSTRLTRKLGEVAVLGDDQPPTFGRLVISARKGFLNLGFAYRDNLSGVNPGDIRMFIDGAVAIPDIDDEHHRVWFKSEEPMPKGKHSIKLQMPDRAGNIASVERLVTVK